MPQCEKVLPHADLDKIEGKIFLAMIGNVPRLIKRGSWTTTAGDVKTRLIVYEQADRPRWDKEANEWKDQPHYTLSITLVDTGTEVRACGISSGSSHDLMFNPDSGAEWGIFEAFSIILEMWDSIH